MREKMHELVSLVNKNVIEYFTSFVFNGFNNRNSNPYYTWKSRAVNYVVPFYGI